MRNSLLLKTSSYPNLLKTTQPFHLRNKFRYDICTIRTHGLFPFCCFLNHILMQCEFRFQHQKNQQKQCQKTKMLPESTYEQDNYLAHGRYQLRQRIISDRFLKRIYVFDLLKLFWSWVLVVRTFSHLVFDLFRRPLCFLGTELSRLFDGGSCSCSIWS